MHILRMFYKWVSDVVEWQLLQFYAAVTRTLNLPRRTVRQKEEVLYPAIPTLVSSVFSSFILHCSRKIREEVPRK